MNKVTWIIENYSKEKSFVELTAAVEKLGYPLVKIQGDYNKEILYNLNKTEKTVLFGDTSLGPFSQLSEFYQPNCVIVNGTIKMCKLLKEDLSPNCHPVLYSNFPKYQCSAYYSHFGPYLFNDKYCLMSLKEIARQKFDVFGHYGKDGLVFIRPDSGEKTFQAGLVDIIDLATLHDSNKDVEHDLMLVSTPKNIKWEGRFICSKYKEIIAHSTYRFQGQLSLIPSVPTGATKMCQEILNKVDYYPDSVFCLDLCQDSDDNFWLLELTSFSSAGLYSSDKKKIVERVSEIAWEDFK